MTEIRLELSDSVIDAVVKMSDGNPGAARVCMELLTEGKQIDPDAFLGGMGNLLSLDTLSLYGSSIWMLYKDVCGENLIKTCAVLRGHQLGYVSRGDILHAINNRGDGLDPDVILAQVQERLPQFGQPPSTETQQDNMMPTGVEVKL